MASPHGDFESSNIASRRESMRGELIEQMRTHHHRRRTRRHVASTAVLLLTAGLLFVFLSPRITPRPIGTASQTPIAEPSRPSIEFQVVSTRKTITDDYVITPVSHVQWIDDQTLLEDLVALNRPSGLVRSGDRSWLTSPVTDEPQP